jgi:hypothetical protein
VIIYFWGGSYIKGLIEKIPEALVKVTNYGKAVLPFS